MFNDSSIIRWRNYSDRYRLNSYKCVNCGKVYFEKKGMCVCGSLEFSEFESNGQGKIIAFTQIHSGPTVYEEQTPYCVAIIQLDEGARISAQVVDSKFDELKIGARVEAVLRKMYKSGDKGVIHYGTKFILKF